MSSSKYESTGQLESSGRWHIVAFVTIAACCSLFCSACRVGDLSAFALQANTAWPIEGKIVDSIPAVDVFAKNAMTLESGGSVAFRSRTLTDGVLSMQLSMKAGNTVVLHTRTTPYSDSVQHDPGVSITIRHDAVLVEPIIPRVQVPVSIRPDEPFIVEIVNDGHWIDVTVACKHIGRFSTIRPSTEWVILSSTNQASCTVVDPTFSELFTQE